jgi:predicted Fe-Mo cluster-binding NifX family protein
MRIAFPTMQDSGLDAPVHNHFGSAAYFVVLNTDDGSYDVQPNPDQNHEHGNCQPLAALGNAQVTAVVVGGIGGGALRKLATVGVTVYQAEPGTISHNLARFKADQLTTFTANMTCGAHVQIDDHLGGCGHH